MTEAAGYCMACSVYTDGAGLLHYGLLSIYGYEGGKFVAHLGMRHEWASGRSLLMGYGFWRSLDDNPGTTHTEGTAWNDSL
jgi:hypothetical protein